MGPTAAMLAGLALAGTSAVVAAKSASDQRAAQAQANQVQQAQIAAASNQMGAANNAYNQAVIQGKTQADLAAKAAISGLTGTGTGSRRNPYGSGTFNPLGDTSTPNIGRGRLLGN